MTEVGAKGMQCFKKEDIFVTIRNKGILMLVNNKYMCI